MNATARLFCSRIYERIRTKQVYRIGRQCSPLIYSSPAYIILLFCHSNNTDPIMYKKPSIPNPTDPSNLDPSLLFSFKLPRSPYQLCENCSTSINGFHGNDYFEKGHISIEPTPRISISISFYFQWTKKKKTFYSFAFDDVTTSLCWNEEISIFLPLNFLLRWNYNIFIIIFRFMFGAWKWCENAKKEGFDELPLIFLYVKTSCREI